MNRYAKTYIFIGAVSLFAMLTMTSISRKESVAKNMSNPQHHANIVSLARRVFGA